MSSHDAIARRKHADLASSAGAGLAGAAIGAWLVGSIRPELERPVTAALLAIGVLLHGWGMLEKQRLERGIAVPPWARAMYWLCWLLLGVLVAWAAISGLR